MLIRTVLFVDYENAYRAARDTFSFRGAPASMGDFDPVRLGHVLAGRSANRELTEVRVYRGRPSQGRDPIGHNANRRQANAWRSLGATVVTRTLRYPDGWPAQPPFEKGIDVVLAVDFVVMAVLGAYDVGIIFSTDSDLEPALERAVELADGRPYPRFEVAAWSDPGRRHAPRLSISGGHVWCHWLGRDDYKAVADPTDYRRARRDAPPLGRRR